MDGQHAGFHPWSKGIGGVMRVEQLRVFVAVAECEHLTRAANDLQMTPSAVSAAIHALEERYGVALFDRVARHIELTEIGRGS